MNITNNRISLLRGEMEKRGLKAIIVPTNDPHFSEYVADYYACRKYITGFSGSAGWAVITTKKAALWTDSRYFLQAEMELEGSEIELMKFGYDSTPSAAEWLAAELTSGDSVGVDAKLYSLVEFRKLESELSDLEVVACDDLFVSFWNDRPGLSKDEIFSLGVNITGESRCDKIKRVRESLSIGDNDAYIVGALDDIAWLLNIRGTDISFCPVVVAYAIVESSKVVLFVDTDKVNDELKSQLEYQKVEVKSYDQFSAYLSDNNNKTYIINPSKTNIFTFNQLKNIKEEAGATIISHLKSVKNSVEIEGFRRAMIEDGIALVKFNMWLDQAIDNSGETSEWEVSEKLREFRSQSPLFRGESFASIVGYKSNGAIVHYKVTPESSRTITSDGFLLLDSGAHYNCGTTDITRTIHLATPTKEEKKDFTLVLLGNINLSMAIFPEGSRGSQIDIFARKALNSHGLNYMHGTGHGIGHFLNVHEGPQSIRKEENSVTIKSGMVTSNEPGLYRTGKYGIRTENIIIAAAHSTTEFGNFMGFETITLFPIDLKCIEIDMLSPSKRAWLNNYHQKVYDTLSQHLGSSEQLWLASKTKKI